MKIKELFKKINIDLSDVQVNQLEKYYELLVEKNKVMNLTAITEYEEVLTKHFLDSALINNVYDMNTNMSVIDVGTGAGFPGMVLKIVFPNLKVTLLDSLNKRVKFLNDVINELGLTTIEAIHSRAEDAGMNPKYREQFDLCVSRAVANLATLSEYCIPFVKVGGKFVSYKADDCLEEVANAEKAINTLGCIKKSVDSIALPETDIIRKFIAIQKQSKTPKKYPRKAGLPTKEPLV